MNNIELEIYSSTLIPQGIPLNWYSLRWTRKYQSAGEFELKCPASTHNLELLKKGNLITRLGAPEFGIIEDFNISQVPFQGDTIVVKGKFGSSILGARILLERFYFNGNVETCIRSIIDKNLITTDARRKIPLLELGTSAGVADVVSYNASMGKNVLFVISKLCSVAGLGFRCSIDYVNSKLKFDLYKGRDLRNSMLFSEADGNIKQSQYECVNSTYKGFALVAGQGEGVARKKINIDDGLSAWQRKELYVDARDIPDMKQEERQVPDPETGTTITEYVDVPIPLAEYQEMLRVRGREKLDEHKTYKSFVADLVFNENNVYRVDWDLGDIVQVYNDKWGVTIEQRVMEIDEFYGMGEVTIAPTFGSPLPTIQDVLLEDKEEGDY